MSDFLTNLVGRHRGAAEVVRPRVPSLYEPYRRDRGLLGARNVRSGSAAAINPTSDAGNAPDEVQSHGANNQSPHLGARGKTRNSEQLAEERSQGRPQENSGLATPPMITPLANADAGRISTERQLPKPQGRTVRPETIDVKSEANVPVKPFAEKPDARHSSTQIPALVPVEFTPRQAVTDLRLSAETHGRPDSADHSISALISPRTNFDPMVAPANVRSGLTTSQSGKSRERIAPLGAKDGRNTHGVYLPAEPFINPAAANEPQATMSISPAINEGTETNQHVSRQCAANRIAAHRFSEDGHASPVLGAAALKSPWETVPRPMPPALVAHPYPPSALPLAHNTGDFRPTLPPSETVRTTDAVPGAHPSQPPVQVSIGRVEVRAEFPEPRIRRTPNSRSRTTLSLDDYLNRRDRGRR